MFDFYGLDITLVFFIPIIIALILITRFMDNANLTTERILNYIPYVFVISYLIQFASLALSRRAWGLEDGKFVAHTVEESTLDSAELLLLEGIPVVLFIITIVTIIRIAYMYNKEESA